MKADIIIVSGFLGAGKTTLIQTWLRENALQGKIAIVENDFGEVGVDAELLRASDVSVTELSAGCICCSLSGNFVRALEELIVRYAPDTILIEPSGVGLLSDVKKACANPRIQALATVRRAITIVDIKRMQRYLQNFGASYEDQIRRADAIVFSRVDQCPALVPVALERVIALNQSARIYSEPLDALSAAKLLAPDDESAKKRLVIGRRSSAAQSAQQPGADDQFQTVTIYTDRIFAPEALHALLEEAALFCTMLIRAKGVLRALDGFILVQHTEGETQIEPSIVNGGFLCLIGSGLDAQRLQRLFEGAGKCKSQPM